MLACKGIFATPSIDTAVKRPQKVERLLGILWSKIPHVPIIKLSDRKDAPCLVDMQTPFARYFCFRKIDMFFALLKTRYDMNSRCCKATYRVQSTYRVIYDISKISQEIYIDGFIFDEIIIPHSPKNDNRPLKLFF